MLEVLCQRVVRGHDLAVETMQLRQALFKVVEDIGAWGRLGNVVKSSAHELMPRLGGVSYFYRGHYQARAIASKPQFEQVVA